MESCIFQLPVGISTVFKTKVRKTVVKTLGMYSEFFPAPRYDLRDAILFPVSAKLLRAGDRPINLIRYTWATLWTWVPDYGFMGKKRYREGAAMLTQIFRLLAVHRSREREFPRT